MPARFNTAYRGTATAGDAPPVEPPRPSGMAWLVVDAFRRDYLCQWYDGPDDDLLRERARAPSAVAAVRWGLARSTRVRIQAADGEIYWAGAGPVPAGTTGRWDESQP